MSRYAACARAGQDRTNLYSEITDKIVAELEAGRVPWVQPWGTTAAKAPLAMPTNAATGRSYSGINVLILWGSVIEHGFPCQGWITFRQALGLGGNVRKGEHGTTVVYADRFIPDDEKKRALETGEEAQAIPFLKRFTVFNIAQCDGLPDDLAHVVPPPASGLVEPKIEALIKATGIDFHIGGSRAFYVPAHDYVQVPPPQAYFEPINWHRTALHELGHARRRRRARPLASCSAETGATPGSEAVVQRAVITISAPPASSDPETAEEDDTIRPLSDRLVTELTAHRTLALRDAVANDPHVAFRAVLHALCLHVFYRHAADTCLEITAKHSGFDVQAPGLADTMSAKAIDARHTQWTKRLPEKPVELWDTLTGLDSDSQAALFAHCASLAVNVVKEPWNRRPAALAQGELLARTVNLDMAAAGWWPTVDNYLGRVPKVRILEAVREAKGEQSAQLIDHLKKADMAKEAERLLEGTGWLPEPLRVADAACTAEPAADVESELEALPAFLSDEDDAEADAVEPQRHAVAAE